MHLSVSFRKEMKQGIFYYVNTLQPSITAQMHNAGIQKELYRYQFHYFLALAQYLTECHKRYVLMKYSPNLSKQPFIANLKFTKWKYAILNNDMEGLGIDKGFINIEKNSEEQAVFFLMDTLFHLEKLPEDNFGESTSEVSLFGLAGNKTSDLGDYLQADIQPELSNFLTTKELFIHFAVSKAMGYYHSFLIKSVEDIEERINAFQYVLAPDN